MATNIRFNYQINEEEIAKAAKLTKELNKQNNISQKELTQLKGKYANVNKQLATTNARLAGMQGQLKKTNSVASTLGSTLGVTFGAAVVLQGLRSGIRLTAEFQREMARVRALTSATGKEFEKLNKLAIDLGRTTVFTAREAAEGMGFLAQAGFNTEQVMGSMKDTLDLAASAQLDLGTAADIVTNIMTGFGIEANELSGSVDILTRQFTSSNTNLQQLGEAMKFAGPVAKGFGIDIRTTAASIGALSDAGLQGSLAGTGFRRVLSGLSQNAKKLGIDVLDSHGNMLPFVDIIESLEERGVTASEAMKLFGERGGPALQVLLDKGSDALREQIALLSEGKTAAQLAEEQMDNLGGDIDRLNSAFEGLILTQGQGFNPVLRSSTSGITRFVEGVTNLTNAFSGGLVVYRDVNKELGFFAELMISLGLATDEYVANVDRVGTNANKMFEILNTGFGAAQEDTDFLSDSTKKLIENLKTAEEIEKERFERRKEEIKALQEEFDIQAEFDKELDKAIEKEIALGNLRDEAIERNRVKNKVEEDGLSIQQEVLLSAISATTQAIESGKALQGIARAAIRAAIAEGVAQAVKNALRDVPFPFNLAAAGGAAAAATALFDTLVPKFAEGGHIKGKRHSQGGVMIEAEGDEFMHRRAAVRHYGLPMMEAINNLEFEPAVVVTDGPKEVTRVSINMDKNGWTQYQRKAQNLSIKKANRYSLHG